MLPLLLAALGALATARVTRLITADRLTLPLRQKVLARIPEGSSAEYLLSCSWCVSFWVGLVIAGAITGLSGLAHGRNLAQVLVLNLLMGLAFSHVTGRLARTEVEL